MIQVGNLTKRYGKKIAVDNLTFTVQPGMVTGFLGPNGSGKSPGASRHVPRLADLNLAFARITTACVPG
jgi:ABC-type uncharacterized transport system ATPase subunit